jgi:hypothetical protein
MARLRFIRAGLTAAALWALSGAAGCTRPGVEAWERDLLSDPAMQLDSNRARDGNDDHIYFSREASSGGRGFGGGGCGCN